MGVAQLVATANPICVTVLSGPITIGNARFDLSSLAETERIALVQELLHQKQSVQIYYFVGGLGEVATHPMVLARFFQRNGKWTTEWNTVPIPLEIDLGEIRALSSPNIVISLPRLSAPLGQNAIQTHASLEQRVAVYKHDSNKVLIEKMTGPTDGVEPHLKAARFNAQVILEGLLIRGRRDLVMRLAEMNIRGEQIPEFFYVIGDNWMRIEFPEAGDIARLNRIMQNNDDTYPHNATFPSY